MKLLRRDGDTFEFQLGRREKDVLLRVIQLYPLVPATHHRLSRGTQIPDQEENQKLLDDALQAQRQANQKQVAALLNEPGRFAADGQELCVTFTRGEMEWLLQVFNDLRVGSWLALGSPDFSGAVDIPTGPDTLRNLAIMEMTGALQGLFLGAISGTTPAAPD
jgi:hypothetical protein